MAKELSKTLKINNEEYNINAVTADKVANTLTVKMGDTTLATFDGSSAKTVTIPEDTYSNSAPTVNALGGIAAGETFTNVPITEMLTKILYPYVAPVIGTTTSSPKNGGVFENGSSQTISEVTSSVTKKSMPITKVELLHGNTVLKTNNSIQDGGNINFTGLNVQINKDTATKYLTVKVTDSENESYTKNTGAFSFVYPYYYGAVSGSISEAVIEGLTKTIETKGSKAYTFNLNNQKAVFAYPKTYGELKSIINQNNYEVISTFIRSELSITGADGTAQTYYVYVSNGASTVSNFKYTFSY